MDFAPIQHKVVDGGARKEELATLCDSSSLAVDSVMSMR